MRPKSPEELYSVLLRAFWTRAYGDLTTAARRKRLTEHDIALIEKRVLETAAEALNAAHEFPEFDARRVIEGMLAEGSEGFRVIRESRAKQIAQER